MLIPVNWLITIAALAVCLASDPAVAGGKEKALALAAPRPIKSAEASRRHLSGSGVFVLEIDKASGKVASVKTQKSTGQPLLDASAIQALRQWRCKPGTVSRIKIPVTFTPTEDAARY